MPSSYKYFIEVSENQREWDRVIDHTEYLCRSTQLLYFPATVVGFIRFVITYATHETVKDLQHIFDFHKIIVHFATGTFAAGILCFRYPRNVTRIRYASR